MILLDTDVISEPWKPSPDPRVLAWLDAQVIDTLFLSVITIAELRFGIAAMAAARDLAVATRDTSPFDAAGLATVDPWTVAP